MPFTDTLAMYGSNGPEKLLPSVVVELVDTDDTRLLNEFNTIPIKTKPNITTTAIIEIIIIGVFLLLFFCAGGL